jgi:hypothetical protein
MRSTVNNLFTGCHRLFLGSKLPLSFHRCKLLQTAAILGLGCFVASQLPAQHSIGLNPGIIRQANATNLQFGASLAYKWQASDDVRVGITAAHFANSDASFDYLAGSYEYILREGALSPYAISDLSLYRIDAFNTRRRVNESKVYVGFVPGFGAAYRLSKMLALNTQLKYHLMLTTRQTSRYGSGFAGLTALEWNFGVQMAL